jgi:hypothetical protein
MVGPSSSYLKNHRLLMVRIYEHLKASYLRLSTGTIAGLGSGAKRAGSSRGLSRPGFRCVRCSESEKQICFYQ